jgi:predicted N-acyltransferase
MEARSPRIVPELRILDSLAAVDSAQWDALAGSNPTISHAFLDALHASGSASPRSGWTVQYPTLWDGGRLVGAAPLYVKAHSFGEYVFDWA